MRMGPIKRMSAGAVTAAIALTLLVLPTQATAASPIGKSALDAIAPIGATLEQARRGLAGSVVKEVGRTDGELVLLGSEVSVGLCRGKVFGVTRQLGNLPGDGLDAVMAITAVAGSPTTKQMRVTGPGGAQGLEFAWPGIPQYQISIVRTADAWSVSESTFQPGMCN